ncbi:hypothetical protein H072_3984 [Dactylellina haptotyla CBS 200.50]|uniref:Rhodopsin domain-containing protein n=1 Tax=Dactylellina haptotyla (strain CBS 200.50) TaxID=1284197 RepID=S8AGY8_DACHA|nr:hypothetical protein H072_3984 [Dactylellina haptotyla CBS 200.50]
MAEVKELAPIRLDPGIRGNGGGGPGDEAGRCIPTIDNEYKYIDDIDTVDDQPGPRPRPRPVDVQNTIWRFSSSYECTGDYEGEQASLGFPEALAGSVPTLSRSNSAWHRPSLHLHLQHASRLCRWWRSLQYGARSWQHCAPERWADLFFFTMNGSPLDLSSLVRSLVCRFEAAPVVVDISVLTAAQLASIRIYPNPSRWSLRLSKRSNTIVHCKTVRFGKSILRALTAIFWTLFAGVTVLTTARLVSRWRLQHRLIDEDYIVLLAYLLLLAEGIMDTITQPTTILIRSLREGRFPSDRLGDPILWIQHLTDYARIQFATKMLFYACLWTVKLSFLMFMRKMLFALPGYSKYWWFVTGLWALTFVGCILSCFTACPTAGAFSTAVLCNDTRDTRANANGLLYGALADVVTDLAIMLLPYPLIRKLRHITFKQKIGVYGIFSLCVVTIAACVIRAANILDGYGKWFDPIWVRLWNDVECLTAVAVGTIPGIISVSKKTTPHLSTAGMAFTTDYNNISGDTTVPHQTTTAAKSKKRGPVADWWTFALRRPSLRSEDEEVGEKRVPTSDK